jgi:hypothetical protein
MYVKITCTFMPEKILWSLEGRVRKKAEIKPDNVEKTSRSVKLMPE